ncbi:MAG TPA: FAD-containing oxidoreductase [Polyangiales bacterium]|nr:FAD-containing oxidoreductase [Polyangiales bacterium]
MSDFDAIVIGAGQSGPSLAVRLAQAGQRVALIERSELGGTCVNNGCIPTKTLVASARAAWVARNAAQWGVQIEGGVKVDMRAVKARKDAIVAESRTGLHDWIQSTPGLTFVSGEARFTSANTLQVGSRELRAQRFFIDCGGRPFVPSLRGLSDVPFLTNVSMLDLDVLPEHLIILGGSYIGIEFAQMYRRFGSQVSVIERSGKLIAREDDEVSEAIAQLLRDDGIEVHLNAEVTAVARGAEAVSVQLGDGSALKGSHLLVAIGRVPNTDTLNLQAAGVRLDARGNIDVDSQLRSTSAPHIWALGDINGRGQFTHTSYNDFEIVAANLLDDEPRKVEDRILIYGLFCDPPLGRVGKTEREVRERGRAYLRGVRPMSRVGRARERGETRGFIKLLADPDSKQFLGAAIFGVEGDEVVHCIADLMYAKAPYTVLTHAVHIHPTVSELLPTVAGSMELIEPT